MGKPEKKVVIIAARTPITARPWPAHRSAAWAMHSRATCRFPAFTISPSPTGSVKACMTGMSEDEFGLWAARELERAIDEIGEDNDRAFIAEPIQGAGGVIIPPATYWPEVKPYPRRTRHPVRVRRGHLRLRPHRRMVRFRHYGTKPDLMAIAKGHDVGLSADGRRDRVRRVAEVLHKRVENSTMATPIRAIRPAAPRP
jgi:putrescine aminotransferase